MSLTQLLKFIIKHFAFLFEEFNGQIVATRTEGFNAFVEFQFDVIRMRIILERDQYFADFRRASSIKEKDWYSSGIVMTSLTGDIDKHELLNERVAKTIRSHFQEIVTLFRPKSYKKSERDFRQFQRERMKRMFG